LILDQSKALDIKPQESTFLELIDMCGGNNLPEKIVDLYANLKQEGVSPSPKIFNSMIISYVKCKKYVMAENVLHLMTKEGVTDPAVALAEEVKRASNPKESLNFYKEL
jgi:pentatricopeptide repeat protein